MSGEKAEGEEPGLGFEGCGTAIVPDGEICALELELKWQLRGDHAFRKALREVASVHETPELGGRGTGYDDDGIEVDFGGSFKQKRNIYCEPGVARFHADGLGEVEPCPPDGGMEDGLEGFSLKRVGKDNGAKGGALQYPIGIEDGGAEALAYGCKDGGIGPGQFPRARIGVKDAERRKKACETTREERLAGGNATRDTQNWHAE